MIKVNSRATIANVTQTHIKKRLLPIFPKLKLLVLNTCIFRISHTTMADNTNFTTVETIAMPDNVKFSSGTISAKSIEEKTMHGIHAEITACE